MKSSRYMLGILAFALLATGATGCSRGKKTAKQTEGEQIQRKLDDIQSHLTVLSEQMDDVKSKQAQAAQEQAALTLKPAAPAQDPYYSKRDQLSQLASRPKTSSKSSKSSKSSTNLNAKHIRVAVPVRDVQRALKNAGFDPGPADGRVGNRTIDAIKRFQRSAGLKVDGIVGQQTWRRLSSGSPISSKPAPKPAAPSSGGGMAAPATPSNDLLPPPADGFTF